MSKKVIVLGIVLILSAVFAVSSAAALPIPPGKDVIAWLEPDPSSGPYGEEISVELWVNTSVDLGAIADWIYFDPDCVNITAASWDGSLWSSETVWINLGDYVKVAGMSPNDDCCAHVTGEHLFVTLTVKCNNSDGSCCTSQLYHNPAYTEMLDCSFDQVPCEWVHGNFSCIPKTVIFEKELVPGWNLISLPLEPEDDSSTSAVLSSMSGNYSAVFRYDSTVKQFEDVTDGTMDPGIGYFVNVTTAGTWSYTGRHVPISVDLKPGLNCIGWGNTSEDISDALSPISGNYTYVARWDADDPKYEVYDANAPMGLTEFIDFETMERGNGYWIAAKEDCTLNV